MQNKIFDVVYVNTNIELLKYRIELFNNIVDKFIIISDDSINKSLLHEFSDKLHFIQNESEDGYISIIEKNFNSIIEFLSPNHLDIFLVSKSNEIPHIDIERYNIELYSNPVCHFMMSDKQSNKFQMGTLVFNYSQFLSKPNFISWLNVERHKINLGLYNKLISGTYYEFETENLKPKIYDCFVFNNELDLLSLRLSLLNDKVEKFILVESRKSHSGQNKELYFEKNKENFSEFLHKINHIIIDDFPTEMIYSPSESDVDSSLHIHWFRENYQRNEILRGLYSENIHDDDVILISDLDEIPDPNKIDQFVNSTPKGDYRIQLQKWFCWDTERKYRGNWPGTAVIRWSDLLNTTPQEIRKNRYDQSKLISGEQFGWHCSWFGGIDKVMEKLKTFAHQELRNTDREDIAKKMTMNLDIHGQQLFLDDDGYKPTIK